ncbi:hypothetical protein UFOVP1290_319 [uncultured Caudovirales phage]|uniref:Uncharacterized protein n=1 Tax=uncultured Caudovirales phage TaxID=2100421 RepID=A0A6J5RII5_9CAUD|nr:hypothetical protein UFOVP1290_319 [uncultured Caudovirales phage]
MILYKDYVSFVVLGQEINLISNETEYGRSTVAEIASSFHYLGNEAPDINLAIWAWEEMHCRLLTNDELDQTLIDNNINQNIIGE